MYYDKPKTTYTIILLHIREGGRSFTVKEKIKKFRIKRDTNIFLHFFVLLHKAEFAVSRPMCVPRLQEKPTCRLIDFRPPPLSQEIAIYELWFTITVNQSHNVLIVGKAQLFEC